MPETHDKDLIFRAQGLTKVYRMGDVEVHALRGIDLELRAGEFVVMLGPSGSGKSTLLNILGGLDVPSAGQMWYHGEDLTNAGDARLTRFRRDNVGFVFQFYNLMPVLTARLNPFQALVAMLLRVEVRLARALRARPGSPAMNVTTALRPLLNAFLTEFQALPTMLRMIWLAWLKAFLIRSQAWVTPLVMAVR